jgi:hypothetical protein
MEKVIVFENFDGTNLTVTVGERVIIDEKKAVELVQNVACQTAACEALRIDIVKKLDEVKEITAQLEPLAKTLESDTAKVKTLVKYFCNESTKLGRPVASTLVEFLN